MKKRITRVILLLLATALAAWALPALVKKATRSPERYPFIYYSSLLKELCVIDYSDDDTPLSDLSGKKYTTAQFDSLLPLLNFRQLMADGRLPDSIDGHAVTPPVLRAASFVFRHYPATVRGPRPALHVLFESMPRRVGLEMPGDVFRLDDKIEFIDCETNRVNGEKSARFQQTLEKRGYRFPARWNAGNPNPRKAYDEGYFSLDADGRLFHLKMVNGKPYARDTRASETVDVAAFSVLEVANKRFYGFLFGKQGEVYILEERDGGYPLARLDIEPFDLYRDQLTIMGNLLYWNVAVTNPSGRAYYALRSEDLAQVAEHRVAHRPDTWERAAGWFFPVYLTLDDPDSAYIYPRLHVTGAWFHAPLLLLAPLLAGRRGRRVLYAIYILITGFAGLLALLALPDTFTKKSRKR
ncbi:MAG: DUF4857 domain-containing protein [Odoribacteraceae bacterium]|jgi:hypothetical protein|nr:DUF4857 domain-containing protein [Odoribacteraceae bacterium]